MSLLGIDVGTTGCKAGLYGLGGELLGSAYREYDMSHPRPGWAELDAEDLWKEIQSVIREAASPARATGDPVTALSVSAMGEVVTPVSRDRRILGNCIVPSADTRGAGYIEKIATSVGASRWYRINPNIPNAGYTLAKLLWIRDNQPELYAQTDLFLAWPDLVQFLLGGEPHTNFSHANRTLLFDLESEMWSDTILEASGIDAEKLPTAAPSGAVVGTVAEKMAETLGLPSGVAIVNGVHDQCGNALGAGVTEAGQAVCGIGTVECITPIYGRIPDLARMQRAKLNVEHHAVPDRYVSFIYNQAGSLVKWYRDTFASADRVTDYEKLFTEVPEDPTKLLVLPYFEMTGAPTFISDASGAIIGLKTSTKRGEILKAILECETFYFAEGLSLLTDLGVDTSEIVATGGGAKSPIWLQIKADVLGIPVVALENTEAGTCGAAINAGIATGVLASAAEGAERYVRRGRRFEPEESHVRYYHERYQQYRELYPALKELL